MPIWKNKKSGSYLFFTKQLLDKSKNDCNINFTANRFANQHHKDPPSISFIICIINCKKYY